MASRAATPAAGATRKVQEAEAAARRRRWGTACGLPTTRAGGCYARTVATPTEATTDVLYFAGRPVATLAAGVLTYLTTDHLGTPVFATDAAGAEVWQGGFEPFGRDWQAGSAGGASENGVFLRLPGQWVDPSWEDATLGVGLSFNVNRWYEPQTGRYSQPDPLVQRSARPPRVSFASVTAPICLGIGLVAVVACRPVDAQEGETIHAVGGVHQSIEWSGRDGAGQGLEFLDRTRGASAHRLLLVSPSGTALVLSSSQNAATGIERFRVADDTTGWWLEVRKELAVEDEDLNLDALLFMDWTATKWSAVLESSGATVVRIDGRSLTPHRGLEAALLGALRAERRLDEVKRAVPRGVVDSLRFLNCLSNTDVAREREAIGGGVFRPPIELLLLLFGEETKPDATWRFAVGHLWKGTTVRDPALIGFTGGFRSISPEDPLQEFGIDAGPRAGSAAPGSKP